MPTHTPPKFALWTLLLLLTFPGPGCAPSPVDRLLQSAPSLDPDFARHLIHDDDSTLVAFCREAGWSRVYFAQLTLAERDHSSLEAFARKDSALQPSRLKLVRAIGPAFDLQKYSAFAQRWIRAPLEARYFAGSRVARIRAVVADTMATDKKYDRIVELMEDCENCTVLGQIGLADVAVGSGDLERHSRHLRAALDAARATGNQPIVCQLLGRLGESARLKGNTDSTVLLWQSGIDLATRHRLVDQVARFHVFLGNHYANEGRWALAEDYLQEARTIVRRPDAAGDDTRYLLESLEFPVRIGCWALVRRDLRAVGASVRRARGNGTPWAQRNEAALQEMQALVAAHDGEVGAADRLFSLADATYAAVGGRIPMRARVQARWARALADGGRYREAEVVARRGLSYCDSARVPEYVSSNAIVLARVMLVTGDLDGCDQALDVFRRAATGAPDRRVREWMEHDAIRARCFVARGDRAATIRALREGLVRLEVDVARMDATPESYSFLSGRSELRDLMHELVSDTPEAGYEIERRWRRATSLVRADAPTGDLSGCADLVARPNGAVRPSSAPSTVANGGPRGADVQVIYYVGDRVWRWTRDRHGIQRVVLKVGPHDLEGRIESVTEKMGRDPGSPDAPVGHALEVELRDLAKLLLPAEVIKAPVGSRPRSLHVFGHGALGHLAFEALNLSPAGYRPLQADWDVTHVRGSGSASSPPARAGTIVADPDLSARMRQMHGSLPQLSYGRAEAQRVATADPSARCLFGASATKGAVTATWEDSRYLFFATHVAEDFDMPYGAFIPLAPDTLAHGADREYLETADVLRARLERCELVVLSGCSSGVESWWVGSATPSLASAFLDAGAAATIRTAWPVRDDQAADLMAQFVDLWRKDPRSAAVALNQVRRRQMIGPHGYRHPFTWAAYGVELADLP